MPSSKAPGGQASSSIFQPDELAIHAASHVMGRLFASQHYNSTQVS